MGRTFVSFMSVVSLLTLVSIGAPAGAFAQTPDGVGIRAQGMGGAFTAVADDATATWWNPAGLATGAYFNMIVEYGRLTEAPDDLDDHRAVSIAFPALGLSYYRMSVSEIAGQSSTGASTGSRQDPGSLGVRASSISQFGATLGQSLGHHLVLASTLKLLRSVGDTEGGLDIGAMAVFGTLRVGAIVRNVREASFGEGDGEISLRRQVRAGASVSAAGRGLVNVATLSFDADLLRVVTMSGEERRIAGGGEVWTARRVLGLRGGVSASTVGDSRVAGSGGVSVALRQGVFVDAQLTGGSDAARRGWGTAFRVTF
jgi:hypothetical protein